MKELIIHWMCEDLLILTNYGLNRDCCWGGEGQFMQSRYFEMQQGLAQPLGDAALKWRGSVKSGG